MPTTRDAAATPDESADDAGATGDRSPSETKPHHHPVLLGIAMVVIAALAVVGVVIAGDAITQDERQNAMDSFYEPPAATSAAAPGDLIRWEALADTGLSNGQGYRILYWSETPAGELRASSGMLFIPKSQAPDGGREIVAWAHGTSGMGRQCAPSRTEDPLSAITWVDGMLANGWIVTATDYAGLGTPGTEAYLIGEAEARDVLNSVRAAALFEDAHASKRFAVYGHSQGGHSSLWTVDQAATYAPELELVAGAAIAPAAELVPLMDLQAESFVAWVIGPEIAVAWPAAHADLELAPFLSGSAEDNYERMAEECIAASSAEGLARQKVLGETFFDKNPMTDSTWVAVARSESVPTPGRGSVPIFVGESTDDEVVLPSTTALLIQSACDTGATVEANWVDDSQGFGHAGLGNLFGPDVTTWLEQRFAGASAPSTCGTTPPVTPANPDPSPTG